MTETAKQYLVAQTDQNELFAHDESLGADESFFIDGNYICRRVSYFGNSHDTRLHFVRSDPSDPKDSENLGELFDSAWLKQSRLPFSTTTNPKKLIGVDLFCGCGGLSLGFSAAAHAMGIEEEIGYASDNDDLAAAVYKQNFKPKEMLAHGIESALHHEIGAKLTKTEKELSKTVGPVDFLVGGPPCQGHSDLNNHTRRSDERNSLYKYMARAAEVFDPGLVIIENVPGARHDRTHAVADTYERLVSLGYSVDACVLDAKDFGVAQTRRRYILVASRAQRVNLDLDLEKHKVRHRPLGWAIEDLLHEASDSTFDTPAQHALANIRRINFLFENSLYDLPDSERPSCHRDKPHSYKSVYGRMYWDKPAQTITTGFGSTGQGRFVHPKKRRTLTPHEAARVQYFPDFFSFGDQKRVKLQKLIGNAVPPKLGYILGLGYFPELLKSQGAISKA